MMEKHSFKPIGIIHSCYKEKFGIPRQPSLVTETTSTLELLSPYHHEDSVRELEKFSHIWLVFVFHESPEKRWKPMVRPPRLGGNKRVGVFASRSPFRPNPIGLSLVELEGIKQEKGMLLLVLRGADLLDKTPILDIKPYIPYADSVDNAKSAYATTAPSTSISVHFSDIAQRQCIQKEQEGHKSLRKLITQILQQDPRPPYKANNTETSKRIYAMKLYDFDLRWRYQNYGIEVVELA